MAAGATVAERVCAGAARGGDVALQYGVVPGAVDAAAFVLEDEVVGVVDAKGLVDSGMCLFIYIAID